MFWVGVRDDGDDGSRHQERTVTLVDLGDEEVIPPHPGWTRRSVAAGYASADQRGGINSAFYLMAYLTMASVVLGVGFVSDMIGFAPTVLGFTSIISCAALALMLVALSSKRVSLW